MLISIITPTFKRNHGIVRAARSVFAQCAGRNDVEFISIDNDPAGGAREVLERLHAESPIPFVFDHEPRAGVSNARNAAMRHARGALIAFLDDDEEAEPGWLDALVHTQQQTRTDAVFGRKEAILEIDNHPHADYIASLHRRHGAGKTGPIDTYFGMSNSLLVRATMLAGPAPFDESANETGGEDDLLFSKGLSEGKRYAWCDEARTTEWVEPRRANLAYALKRAFAYGQGPCETAWSAPQRDYLGLARHMCVGAAQTLVFGAAACIAFPLRAPTRMDLLDRAVRGAGKVAWWSPQRFYGAARKD
jgi:glycosyltransferase involved in cell wall biosynthesis